MSDYLQDAVDADAAFREDGQLLTITRTLQGPYVDGDVTVSSSSQQAWGIETAVTAHDFGFGNETGSLVQMGDRKLLVSALADDGTALLAPQVNDLALAGGVTYTIKNVSTLSPGGVVLMYTLIGRT